MNYEERIKSLLSKVQSGELKADQAFEQLKRLPFSDLGFAKVDHHRELRHGLAEVVFCEGKTPEQTLEIARTLLKENTGNILFTHAGREHYESIKALDKRAQFHETARLITIIRDDLAPQGLVSVVSGGTADIPVAEEARITALSMGSKVEAIYDVGVAGVHRLFAHLETLNSSSVVVVVAGMDGALASVVGGAVSCPVIAVPTGIGYGANFGGLTTLLAMINSCAPGVSVVNVDNGFGAGYIAALVNRMVSTGENNR